ncbi:MAG: TIR domain-containing protein [Ruminococcaceae bacterium]|nr:TIR domain-containing protein [Oscillospiraceae bacterium]
MMERTPTAYEGKQPYIFVSYAHKDSARVLPIISSLIDQGFRVWYDAGIEAGTEWPEYIASHLAGADCVLAFLSPSSIASKNCRQEITFALSRDRSMLTVFLEDVKLPMGLEMQLGLTQAMFYHRHDSLDSFMRELVKADVISDCREESPLPPENAEKPAPSAAQSSVAPAPEPAPAPAEPAPAPAPAAPGLFNLKNDEMTVVDGVLERYHGQKERVEIPEGVTVIGSEVFKRNATLKSIRLPRSLVTIRAWAFADCPALEEITIPGGVEVVSSNLFVGSGLKRVILSEGVTTVGIATFKDCTSLSYVGLPKSLKTVGEEAFKGCKSLTRLHLPEGVSYAKEGSKRSFPATVKFVDENGVLLKTEKTTPTPPPAPKAAPAPKPLFDIVDGVLRACRGECKRITIPVSAKEIGACVFLNRTELLSVNVPGTVHKIGKSAFEGCKNLELVTFAHGLFEIGDWAFKGCESIKSIEIPDTVTKVGALAFDDCPALKEIRISKKAHCYRALKKMLPKDVKLTKF